MKDTPSAAWKTKTVVQGIAFVDDNCVRLSYATSEDKLIEAAKRMKAAVEALQ